MPLSRHVPNDRLVAARIPPTAASWHEISRFALTFDGYAQCGSFTRCAAVANARRHATLTDLRTCLFFEQRRWRHLDAEPDAAAMAYIRDLLEQIRARVLLANQLLA
jgi:hypothetical protein